MSKKRIKCSFYLRDESGQKFYYESNVLPRMGFFNIYHLILEFKKFLINCGYSKSLVDRVTYKDISEDEEEYLEL